MKNAKLNQNHLNILLKIQMTGLPSSQISYLIKSYTSNFKQNKVKIDAWSENKIQITKL